jgi:hypothetical protein
MILPRQEQRAMYRNLVCLAGGIAVALYLFLPAPLRLYVPAAFAVPAVLSLLAPLAYRRLQGIGLEGRELLGAGLLTVFLALVVVLPFLEGSVALACVVVASLVLWYAGIPPAQTADEIAEPSES